MTGQPFGASAPLAPFVVACPAGPGLASFLQRLSLGGVGECEGGRLGAELSGPAMLQFSRWLGISWALLRLLNRACLCLLEIVGGVTGLCKESFCGADSFKASRSSILQLC